MKRKEENGLCLKSKTEIPPLMSLRDVFKQAGPG